MSLLKKTSIGASLVLVAMLIGILNKDAITGLIAATPPAVEVPPPVMPQIETGDDSAYQMVIRGRLAQVQTCYNDLLKKGLKKSGKLVVKWTVNPEGQSSDFIEELNELGSSELYDCTTTAIAAWPFPKNKSLMIRYTFKMRELEKPKAEREVANTKRSKNNDLGDEVQNALGEL
ncbi:MAG: AgmX/PglI C-terminal domain-containing protein [Pseudobdellovibrionaceae bacterium]